MGITSSRTVIITDENNEIIKIYNSIGQCSKNEKITPYKIEQYSRNHILYNNKYYNISKENVPKFSLVKCDLCGKEFLCENYRIKKSNNIYCSIECRDKALNGEDNCICPVCGKQFHKKPSHVQKYHNTYCSRECHKIAKEKYMLGELNHQFGLKGSLNCSWKSDVKISTFGYRQIRVIDHPFRNSDDFVFEHRLIAEQFLLTEDNSIEINGKKYLSKEYVVHHINFDRLDNNINNLIVMKLGDHISLHQLLNNDIEQFKKYCIKYNLDFEKTYATHLYNIEKYKYRKNEVVEND